MLSKSQIGLLKSLQQKKFRREHGFFLVEGHKSVTEFAQSNYQIESVYYTPDAATLLNKLPKKLNFQQITDSDIQKISSLTTPQQVIALVKIPAWPLLNAQQLKGKFSLVLDGIQDPGNLGTIIRTADWFGIEHIICSEDTVDAYNPKVVQATMGSLARVNIHYTGLANILPTLQLPLYGALLKGNNIYQTDFGTEGLIVMGNEGNGLRPEIEQLVSHAITIPRLGKAESLNVAIATSIFCSEVSRKTLK
ncbi:RNA methyltransferase [Mucilaginibacter koreensis]